MDIYKQQSKQHRSYKSASQLECDAARICCCVCWCLQHGARNTPTAIDRYLLPAASAGRSAANQPAAVAAVDRLHRQRDGQTTDTRPLHRPCSAYYVGTEHHQKQNLKNEVNIKIACACIFYLFNSATVPNKSGLS